MPLRPASVIKASLAGLVLAGLAAWPLLAQQDAPAKTAQPAEPAQPTELRPGVPLESPSSEQPATPSAGDETAPAALPDEDALPAPDTGAAEPGTEAGDGSADEIPSAADLQAVESSLSLSQDKIDALKKEIADMEGDRTQQNAALIAAAQRVKLAEIEVNDVENRLSDLIVKELQVRGRLDGADAQIANVLAALERISLNPPPALIVNPDDALGSARGAMLISAIVPQLRAKADSVAADLKSLQDIKAAAQAEEATLKANHAVLEEEQLRIATLIAARKQGITQKTAELEAEQAEAIELAKKASTLRELVGALTERAAAGAAGTTANAAEPETPTLSPEAIQLAFANAARTEPAIPFPLAHGYLARPAVGQTVVPYGVNDGQGGISHGQSLITSADAQVVAPADGWVLYKGPYLNYGQIVIINTGSGYTTLLAGLDQISVDIGQFVMMGEPVGTMGSRTIGRTVTTKAGNAQPTLYIELRKNNEPFDPEGWWAKTEQTG